jgi:hypothetical protein
MIKLIMINYGEMSEPLSLEINGKIYTKDMFLKLNDYIDSEIIVYNTYLNKDTKSKSYRIHDVFKKDGIPTLDLRDINI